MQSQINVFFRGLISLGEGLCVGLMSVLILTSWFSLFAADSSGGGWGLLLIIWFVVSPLLAVLFSVLFYNYNKVGSRKSKYILCTIFVLAFLSFVVGALFGDLLNYM